MSRLAPRLATRLRVVTSTLIPALALSTLVFTGAARSTPATSPEPPTSAAAADLRPAAARTGVNSSEFRLLGTETFDRLDRSRWQTYQGRPGCCPDTWWDRSRVGVKKGNLRVWNAPNGSGKWLSGGVSAQTGPYVRTYGRYEARVALSGGAGNSAVALLWPTQGWPPEIDYFEFDHRDANRRRLMMTHHYDSGSRMAQSFISGDFTRFHTVAVEWTPTRLDYFLDGRLVKRERDASKIPHRPMFPAFQTQVHRNSAGKLPARGTTLKVASLRVWGWRG